MRWGSQMLTHGWVGVGGNQIDDVEEIGMFSSDNQKLYQLELYSFCNCPYILSLVTVTDITVRL